MPKTINMNTADEGDISGRFEIFSKDLNQKTVRRSFVESNERIAVPGTYTEKIIAYAATIRCQ
jgi:hypothetical protein